MVFMQLFDINGFMDLYIGPPMYWGFELLRDGDCITEHLNRFLAGGCYHKMVQDERLKEMVVLDMRSVNTGAPRAVESGEVKVIRVCFQNEYKQAVVHGLGNTVETIQLGADKHTINNSSSMQFKICN